MAWSWKKAAAAGGGDRDQPDSKRRKVDVPQVELQDVTEEDWGDDDYTQDQLEELALMDSQVEMQTQVPAAEVIAEYPTVSRAEMSSVSRSELSTMSRAEHSSGSRSELSSVSRSELSSVSKSELSRAEVSSVSFVVPVGAARRSTSSSSNSSGVSQSLFSSRSAYETSTSLSSHSSSNGKLDTSLDLVHTLQARLDEEKRKAQEEKNCYDGQVKTLREKMHKQEEELERLRALRDESYEQQKQSLNEEIGKLKSQLGNMTTQSCFKDREYQNLQEKYAVLQRKVKKIEQQQSASGLLDVRLQLSPKPASPRKVSVEPSPPSKLRQQETRNSTSSRKTNFPTAETFMQQASPVCSALPPKSVSSISCQTPGTGSGNKPARCRLHLNIGSFQAFGEMSGPQVVRHLLQLTELDSSDERLPWDSGLAGLLQDMSTSLKITGLTYSREKDSQFLTPVRPRRHTQGMGSASVDTTDATVQIVTRHNLQLAIEGIAQLLQDTNGDLGKGGLDWEISRISETGVNTNNPTQAETAGVSSATAGPSRGTTQTNGSLRVDSVQNSEGLTGRCLDASKRRETSQNSGAVLILPLLTNYIQHYVDLVHSPSGRVGGTLNTSGAEGATSPQSLDSSTVYSFDSLSSHLGLLLQEGRTYASNIEGCALTALRCLATLVYLCPAVRNTLVMSAHPGATPLVSVVRTGGNKSSSSSAMETGSDQSKKSMSSADADDEGTTGSSEIRIIKTGSNHSNQSVNSCSSQQPATWVSSCLFNLVLRLAGQDVQHGQSNPEVVILALRILTCLCQRSTEEELPKLEPIITSEILSKCFRQRKQTPILVHAVKLLLSLATCKTLLAKLCKKSDRCPIYLMHRACSLKAEGMFDLQTEYVTCLSTIICQHRSGMHFLLSNSCPCTHQLVAAVTLTLYNLFSDYTTAETSHQPHILNTLAQGMSLIHTLAQGNNLFVQHFGPVNHQYVRLITGVTSLLKLDPQTWDHYLQVMEELNEFDTDHWDISQESPEEYKMDQS